MNIKQYDGLTCKKCESTLKWKSSKSCVPCGQKRVKESDRSQYKYPKYKAAYYVQTLDKWRNYHYKKKFNISLDEYNKMLDKQDRKCYICKAPNDSFKRSLAVDHNHKTGKIRKLLCLNCNRAIGNAKDSIKNLLRMAKYLKEH